MPLTSTGHVRKPLLLAALPAVLALGGCAEKKTCYFLCYEPALEGYDEGNCGEVLELTEAECRAWTCDGRPARTSWGKRPSWCEAVSEHADR
jgi:hypothetical protein